MKKRTFRPLFTLLIYSFVSSALIGVFAYIFIFIKGENNGWNDIQWWYTLLAAFCIAIPFGCAFFIPRIKIDLDSNKVDIFYLVNWKRSRLDCDSNWVFYLDQIEDVKVVKLTNDEKKTFTSSRFLFRKYLKVQLRFGNIKYVYVAPYSNGQIKKIIKMLKK